MAIYYKSIQIPTVLSRSGAHAWPTQAEAAASEFQCLRDFTKKHGSQMEET